MRTAGHLSVATMAGYVTGRVLCPHRTQIWTTFSWEDHSPLPQVEGKIIPMITALQWPMSGRSYVSGSGVCLGLVNEEAPYIYVLVNKGHQLISSLNAVARALQAYIRYPCLWTSIKVNVNTISSVHTGSNNVRLSLIMGLGSFSGGELKLGVQTYDVKKTDGYCWMDTCHISRCLLTVSASLWCSSQVQPWGKIAKPTAGPQSYYPHTHEVHYGRLLRRKHTSYNSIAPTGQVLSRPLRCMFKSWRGST